ncbi:MAG: hypothetical protein SGI92_05015 [Bryobacteraceae bacterium]|nr:hypothetical protein [Bryobacteraceae bacterium]
MGTNLRRALRPGASTALIFASLILVSCDEKQKEDKASIEACTEALLHLLPQRPQERADRFTGKVEQFRALCRGGQRAVAAMNSPWVDWSNYWGTGDTTSLAPGILFSKGPLSPSGRGVTGALLDLELQRVELIRFNLFENSGTFKEYILGRNKVEGPVLRSWTPFELPKDHPAYKDIRIVEGEQLCQNDLIRGRTLTGICNDVRNPLMGATGQLFARNVEFDTTFPDLGGKCDGTGAPRRPYRASEAGSAGNQPPATYADPVEA